jgi:hypothetical protein
VPINLAVTLDYFTWACTDSLIEGGSVDLVVHNSKGDRLSVFITYGSNCARSPNSLDFQASDSVLDATSATISLEGKSCGGSPCCIIVECLNTPGFPCCEWMRRMRGLQSSI